MSSVTVKAVVILGSGTSTGVPVIGCACEVCRSEDARDKRTRCSIAVKLSNNKVIVVDTSPEFRLQVLSCGIRMVDGVLFTHTHADHCHGFDDLRVFSFYRKDPLPAYAAPIHAKELRQRFHYAFEDTGYSGAIPQIDLKEIEGSEIELADFSIETVGLPHGLVTTTAFRFGSFAYATDFKEFPPDVLAKWRGRVDYMVASGIRFRPHKTHSHIQDTLAIFKKLGVKRGVITHLSHDVGYLRDQGQLPPGVEFAYDGMVIDLPG